MLKRRETGKTDRFDWIHAVNPSLACGAAIVRNRGPVGPKRSPNTASSANAILNWNPTPKRLNASVRENAEGTIFTSEEGTGVVR